MNKSFVRTWIQFLSDVKTSKEDWIMSYRSSAPQKYLSQIPFIMEIASDGSNYSLFLSKRYKDIENKGGPRIFQQDIVQEQIDFRQDMDIAVQHIKIDVQLDIDVQHGMEINVYQGMEIDDYQGMEMEVPQDKEISFKQDMEIDVKKDMDISLDEYVQYQEFSDFNPWDFSNQFQYDDQLNLGSLQSSQNICMIISKKQISLEILYFQSY
ncbi:hypothetical protein pb186bvf_020135 [Paramecium bursaria]